MFGELLSPHMLLLSIIMVALRFAHPAKELEDHLATAKALSIGESNNCKTEKDSLSNRIVYTSVSVEPVNEGGTTALMQQYRKICMDDYNAVFVVAFIVEPTGEITHARVVSDNTGKIGQQIIDRVKRIKWKPGVCNGRKVPVIHKLRLRVCSH